MHEYSNVYKGEILYVTLRGYWIYGMPHLEWLIHLSKLFIIWKKKNVLSKDHFVSKGIFYNGHKSYLVPPRFQDNLRWNEIIILLFK